MFTELRRVAILVVLIAAAALLLTPTLHAAASPPAGTPESILLEAANRSRAAFRAWVAAGAWPA